MTIAIAIALFATSAPGAGAYADAGAIDSEVARFTGAAIGAPGGAVRPVDRRLRLRACNSALAVDWRTARRDTVTVRCGDPGGWRLFVPVMAAQAAAGVPAGHTSFAAAPAVNRGDAVSIAITGRGFTVSRPAEALEAGAVGDWIRIRPVTARRGAEDPLRARILRPGVVGLPIN